MDTMRSWLRSRNWTRSGAKWHLIAGIGGPLLALCPWDASRQALGGWVPLLAGLIVIVLLFVVLALLA